MRNGSPAALRGLGRLMLGQLRRAAEPRAVAEAECLTGEARQILPPSPARPRTATKFSGSEIWLAAADPGDVPSIAGTGDFKNCASDGVVKRTNVSSVPISSSPRASCEGSAARTGWPCRLDRDRDCRHARDRDGQPGHREQRRARCALASCPGKRALASHIFLATIMLLDQMVKSAGRADARLSHLIEMHPERSA